MWPYWIVFALPAAIAVASRRRVPSPLTGLHSVKMDAPWLFFILLFTVFIGLRVNIGADWFSYLGYLERGSSYSFTQILKLKDPGYQLVNWVSARFGSGIWGVNLFCGLVFSIGLMVFSRSLPRPWLALSVGVPYLLIVVAMGYSRQAVALGFAMMGLVALGRGKVAWFAFWIFFGAIFHRSAVLLIPIAALSATKNRYWVGLWLGLLGSLAYVVLLEDSLDALYYTYFEKDYQSQGAYIRSLMNFIPAAIFLGTKTRFNLLEADALLWRWFSLMSLALVPVLLVTSSSAAVDRVALYMLPLQLVVFSRLPDAWARTNNLRELLIFGIVLYYGLVLFVWLSYSSHASSWLPYRNFLFQ